MNDYLRKAKKLYELKDYEAALQNCDAILREGKRECRLLYLAALCCMKLEKLSDAKEFLHQATIYDPLQETIWFKLGVVCSKLGSLGEAIEAYHNALQINSRLASAYNGLAVTYAGLGEFKLSAQQIELAFQIDPENYNIRMNREKILKVFNS